MKLPLLAAIATLTVAQAFALGPTVNAAAPSASSDTVHRYVVESTSPPNSHGKAKASEASLGVRWLRSYSTADKTRTYSLYEAPNEEAIRKAAAHNKLALIHVDEAPVDLDSESDARSGNLPAGMHRYMIERTFPAGALDGLDSNAKSKVNATNSTYGAQWVTSYANSDKTKTYCVYNAADEAAVRAAAKANGIPVDKVTEVPNATAAREATAAR
jgi:hypothetical protein